MKRGTRPILSIASQQALDHYISSLKQQDLQQAVGTINGCKKADGNGKALSYILLLCP